MGKLLLFVVIAVVVYVLLKTMVRKSGARVRPEGVPQAEAIVPCARCGVHLPRGEAIEDGGLFYCGEDHRRLGSG